MGVLAIFSTATYAIIGTMCVKSETCNEKYHEKKIWCRSNDDLAVTINDAAPCSIPKCYCVVYFFPVETAGRKKIIVINQYKASE